MMGSSFLITLHLRLQYQVPAPSSNEEMKSNGDFRIQAAHHSLQLITIPIFFHRENMMTEVFGAEGIERWISPSHRCLIKALSNVSMNKSVWGDRIVVGTVCTLRLRR